MYNSKITIIFISSRQVLLVLAAGCLIFYMQLVSMGQAMKTVERLSQMGQEMAESNERIINSSKLLNEKSGEPLGLIGRA